jgi:hypothetical protein
MAGNHFFTPKEPTSTQGGLNFSRGKPWGMRPLSWFTAFLFDTNISVQYHLELEFSSHILNIGG